MGPKMKLRHRSIIKAIFDPNLRHKCFLKHCYVLLLFTLGCAGPVEDSKHRWADPAQGTFHLYGASSKSMIDEVVQRGWRTVGGSNVKSIATQFLEPCPKRLMCLRLEVASGFASDSGWVLDDPPIECSRAIFIGWSEKSIRVATTEVTREDKDSISDWHKPRRILLMELPIGDTAKCAELIAACEQLLGEFRNAPEYKSRSWDASTMYIVRQWDNGRIMSYAMVNPEFLIGTTTKYNDPVNSRLAAIYKVHFSIWNAGLAQ
jgi:hypothetical protein